MLLKRVLTSDPTDLLGPEEQPRNWRTVNDPAERQKTSPAVVPWGSDVMGVEAVREIEDEGLNGKWPIDKG